MENMEKIPNINQAFRNAALNCLIESGMPESLIEGVDCSSIESMEESIIKVKECYYSAIYNRITETYGTKGEPKEKGIDKRNYKSSHWWEMFKGMNCDPEDNKYIANLQNIISTEVQIGEFSRESKKLSKKEDKFLKLIESGMDEKELEIFREYLDLQGEIKGEIETESFIYGFRIAYHLLNECR